MFHMMNEARIGVGLGATAIGFAGYTRSLRYARERLQGRPVERKDPTSSQVPIIDHADVRRMLLAQKAYLEGGLALGLYCGMLVDEEAVAGAEERQRIGLLLDVLTPIAKAWPSRWCLAANDLAIQVHGGYGYAREYLVEQLYRDNRLNPIHEGTNGIQAIDLLGRKVGMREGAGFAALLAEIDKTIAAARAAGGERGALAARLGAARERLEVVTRTLLGRSAEPEVMLANASSYLEAAGHVVVAWLLLDQLEAVERGSGPYYDGKRQAVRWFFAHELPHVDAHLDLLAAFDPTVLEMRDEWF